MSSCQRCLEKTKPSWFVSFLHFAILSAFFRDFFPLLLFCLFSSCDDNLFVVLFLVCLYVLFEVVVVLNQVDFFSCVASLSVLRFYVNVFFVDDEQRAAKKQKLDNLDSAKTSWVPQKRTQSMKHVWFACFLLFYTLCFFSRWTGFVSPRTGFVSPNICEVGEESGRNTKWANPTCFPLVSCAGSRRASKYLLGISGPT